MQADLYYYRGRLKVKQPKTEIQFSEIIPDYNQRNEEWTAFLCVNGVQQKRTVTRKLISNNDKNPPNNKHRSLINSRTRKGVQAFPGGASGATDRPPPLESPAWLSLGHQRQLPRDDCTFIVPQSLPEILTNGSSIRPTPRDTVRLQELPHTSTPLYARTPRNLQARRMRFRPCLLACSQGSGEGGG